LLCEELKHLYVAITRAKNNLVIFDRDPERRAALYYFLRRLGLAIHVRSVTSGMAAADQQSPDPQISSSAAAAAGGSGGRQHQQHQPLDGARAFRGSLSNTPQEWAKRAGNLVEMQMFKLAAQCYGCAGDALRAAAYGAYQQLQVRRRHSVNYSNTILRQG
jgi:ATP-dependent exoDNAse (exonuclease V) beta subunit